MSIKSLKRNHREFEKNIKTFLHSGLQVTSAMANTKSIVLNKNEKEILLESLLLRSCANWERFIEDEIVLLVFQDSESFKNYFGLENTQKLSQKLISVILYKDSYRDFHVIDRSKNFYSQILVEKYNPFTSVSNERIQIVQNTFTIRNYLSHYSDSSRKKLRELYIKKYNINSFQEPGRFLIKNSCKNFKTLVHNFILISKEMRLQLNIG